MPEADLLIGFICPEFALKLLCIPESAALSLTQISSPSPRTKSRPQGFAHAATIPSFKQGELSQCQDKARAPRHRPIIATSTPLPRTTPYSAATISTPTIGSISGLQSIVSSNQLVSLAQDNTGTQWVHSDVATCTTTLRPCSKAAMRTDMAAMTLESQSYRSKATRYSSSPRTLLGFQHIGPLRHSIPLHPGQCQASKVLRAPLPFEDQNKPLVWPVDFFLLE